MVEIVHFYDPEAEMDWQREQDFHIYEREFLAKHPQPVTTFSNLGVDNEWRIGIAAARAKDKARRNLIKAIHKAQRDTFLFSVFYTKPKMTRSVDGKDGAPDSEILL